MFSPIGDITTIMLWLAGKFSAEYLVWGFAIFAILLVSVTFFLKRIVRDTIDSEESGQSRFWLTRSERIIVSLALLSFSLPLVSHFFGLPPYMDFSGV